MTNDDGALEGLPDDLLHQKIAATRQAAIAVKRNNAASSAAYQSAVASLATLSRQITALDDFELEQINIEIMKGPAQAAFANLTQQVDALSTGLAQGQALANQVAAAVDQITAVITAIGGVLQ